MAQHQQSSNSYYPVSALRSTNEDDLHAADARGKKRSSDDFLELVSPEKRQRTGVTTYTRVIHDTTPSGSTGPSTSTLPKAAAPLHTRIGHGIPASGPTRSTSALPMATASSDTGGQVVIQSGPSASGPAEPDSDLEGSEGSSFNTVDAATFLSSCNKKSVKANASQAAPRTSHSNVAATRPSAPDFKALETSLTTESEYSHRIRKPSAKALEVEAQKIAAISTPRVPAAKNPAKKAAKPATKTRTAEKPTTSRSLSTATKAKPQNAPVQEHDRPPTPESEEEDDPPRVKIDLKGKGKADVPSEGRMPEREEEDYPPPVKIDVKGKGKVIVPAGQPAESSIAIETGSLEKTTKKGKSKGKGKTKVPEDVDVVENNPAQPSKTTTKRATRTTTTKEKGQSKQDDGNADVAGPPARPTRKLTRITKEKGKPKQDDGDVDEAEPPAEPPARPTRKSTRVKDKAKQEGEGANVVAKDTAPPAKSTAKKAATASKATKASGSKTAKKAEASGSKATSEKEKEKKVKTTSTKVTKKTTAADAAAPRRQSSRRTAKK